jgi:hypothetical protein
MNTLYWLTRLDSIHNLLIFFVFVGIAFFVMSIIFFISEDKKTSRLGVKGMIFSSCFVLTTLVVRTFIPTTNEALIIYGVGNTIDYVKSNDTAKQLPDKAIEALDKYLDSLNNKDE